VGETRTTRGTVVRHPDDASVVDSSLGLGAEATRRRRSAVATPAEAASPSDLEAIVSAAELQDMRAVDAFDVVPPATPDGLRRRTVLAEEPVEVRVPLDAGEEAVVLLESDGIFAWQMPEHEVHEGVRRRRTRDGDVAVFRLPLVSASAQDERQRRGWIADRVVGLIAEPIRAVVLKFAADAVADIGIRVVERHVSERLVLIDTADPTRWGRRDATLGAGGGAAAPRILLLVHGTFSSTVGSFAALGSTPRGAALIRRALASYDLVVGYDHKTLSLDENASALVDALRALDPPPGAVIDAIAYSRGGLVLRAFAEKNLPASGLEARIGSAVFVGCTHGGTALADPENWHTLLDLYTNVAAAAARIAGHLGGPVAGIVLAEAVKTLGGLARALTDRSLAAGRIPGLASMMPSSELVAELRSLPVPDDDISAYYAVTADFEPDPADPAPGLGAGLAMLLADRFIDRLMGAENDLVVDTEAMAAFGERAASLRDRFDFGTTSSVYHTIYFSQDRVLDALERWLRLESSPRALEEAVPPIPDARPAPREAERDARRPEDAVPRMVGPRRRRGGDGGEADERGADERGADEGPVDEDEADDVRDEELEASDEWVGAPPPPAPSPASTLPSGVATFPVHVHAEMSERPVLERPAMLHVTVPREALDRARGATSALGTGTVRDDEVLTVQVVPRRNCRPIGPDRTTIDVRSMGQTAEIDFEVEGLAPGEAELWVVARQGPRRVVTLVLQPVFVPREARIATGGSAEAESGSLVELLIYEDDTVRPRLLFVLRSDDLDLNEHFFSYALHDETKAAYIQGLYGRLGNYLGRDRFEYDDFMHELREIGSLMYEQLVPIEIRRKLWEVHERIGSIRVMSQEPAIPWELAHIKEPNRPLPAEGVAFLAEKGLVRWLHNLSLPPARLRYDPAACHYLIPDYERDRDKLPAGAEERELVRRLFAGAAAVEPSTRAVRRLLGTSSAFDLLHIACHGVAESSNIWEAALILQIPSSGDRNAGDRLAMATVMTSADLWSTRPIVFLNACQVGVRGRLMTGTGGLADAFLRQGAGVVVGSLWSIADEEALTFATAFYEALTGGATLIQATAAARSAAAALHEPTWLSYTVYGHPYARLERR
jgi:hypothetical protein